MSNNISADASLLSRVAQGDRVAFRELYERTSGRLFAVALKMLSNRPLAEDVLQDAYVKIWYAAGSFDAAQGSAMGWLVAIVRNGAIDRLRGERVTSVDNPSEALLTPALDEDHQKLQDCLSALDTQQRQSIFAAFFQGLTHREISARFAEPIGTIKSRVRRGLQSLKGCLQS